MSPSTAGAPAVTVVLNTHNRRVWLERCLQSVLGQQGVSFEVVVVDDASTDDTGEYLQTVGDPRVTVVRIQKQPELSPARNRGLHDARGEFVMFLDDDDWLERGALRTLGTALAAHPEAVAAVGARRAWFMTEGYSRRDSHPHSQRSRNIFDDLLVDWSAVSGQSLYRTELVRKIGGFDVSVGRCQDRDLWLRLAVLGPVVLRPEIVMTYRYHPRQLRFPNIRELREEVACRAIDALPPSRRLHGVRLRRTTWHLDEAETAFTSGSIPAGVAHTLRAVANTPRIFASPLIGPWTVRRLGGRLARRFRPRPPLDNTSVAPIEE